MTFLCICSIRYVWLDPFLTHFERQIFNFHKVFCSLCNEHAKTSFSIHRLVNLTTIYASNSLIPIHIHFDKFEIEDLSIFWLSTSATLMIEGISKEFSFKSLISASKTRSTYRLLSLLPSLSLKLS